MKILVLKARLNYGGLLERTSGRLFLCLPLHLYAAVVP